MTEKKEKKKIRLEKNSGINQKILKIMADIEGITESAKNSFHGYSYAPAKEVVGKVRKAMIKNGVIMGPTEIIDKNFLDHGVIEYSIKWSLIDADTGEKISYILPTEGQEISKEGKLGDKASFKATTGGIKYFFRVAFALSVGWDDPENDDKNQSYLNEPIPKNDPKKDKELKEKLNKYLLDKTNTMKRSDVESYMYGMYGTKNLDDLSTECKAELILELVRDFKLDTKK